MTTGKIRYLLSRNPRLLTRVLQACIRALFAVARKRAKAAGLQARHPGAITFIQRFGSALQLNVHFHVVMADGLFDDDGSFQHLPPLHDEDVEHILSKTIRNIVRTCGESILGGDETEPSALSLLDGQALVPLSSSSRAYQPPEYKPLTAREQGFTLHAATRVAASNPRGLFRLCAYGARGAIASSRLSRLTSGTFTYELKRPLSDGRKTLVWTGEQLVRKLVPLIPPPFANLTRFHGVFAPRAKLRERVVAQVKGSTSSASAKPQATSPENERSILDVLPKRKPKTKKGKRYRLDWASLLSRIFAIDVMTRHAVQRQTSHGGQSRQPRSRRGHVAPPRA